jgi:hypothetical protein
MSLSRIWERNVLDVQLLPFVDVSLFLVHAHALLCKKYVFKMNF